MESTQTRFVAKVLMLLFCLTLHYGTLEGKAMKKPKHTIHAIQKSGSKKHEAPKGGVCMDHAYCFRYTDLDCASEWVNLNCPKTCRRCENEGPDIMKLPAVIYYRKGVKKHSITTHKKNRSKDVKKSKKKHQDHKRDVVFLKKTTYNSPTTMPPTTSYNLFDYKSNYRNWYFMYPDRYDNRATGSDSTQQYAQQQQQQQQQFGATNAASSAPAASPVVAAVPPAARVNAPASIAAPGQAAIASAPVVTSPMLATVPALAPGSTAALQSTNQAASNVPTADVQQPIAQPSYAVKNQTIGAQQLQPTVAASATAFQPENQTIELINETVTVANETETPVVETGFQPAVASVLQPNKTMTGASPPVAQVQGVAPVSATTVATNQTTTTPAAAAVIPVQGKPTVTSGSNTSQYQPQPLEEVHPQNQSLLNDVNTSYNLSLPLEEFHPQNVSLVNGSNTSQNSLQPQAELQLPNVSQAGLLRADQLKPLQSQWQSVKQPPSSNTPSTINVTQEIFQSAESSSSKSVDESSEPITPVHKLHITSTGEPNEVFGNFNPNSVAITLSGTGSVDVTSTGQSVTQDVMVNPQSPAQNTEQSADCCKDLEEAKGCIPCPKMPKAPPLAYVFNIYCNDLNKNCAYGYSNCNDTWWQINCPKRCNLCKAKDNVKHTPATKTKEIYPNKVADLPEMGDVLESDLVAPAPGEKPLVAKYTLRVKPKLLNGVPQTQEIRIMPPSKVGYHGTVKPLMVLKQNITKPMIENIEIDVPKKGKKYSSKPSVEVIEGNHKEMLKVNKGLALVENAVQKSKTNKEEYRTEKPQETTNKDSTEPTESPITPAPVVAQEPSGEVNTPLQSSTEPATAAPVSPPPAIQTDAYTGAQTCTNDERCNLFTDDRCSEEWLKTNCRNMCKLC